jgi:hypothetical protein
MFKRWHHDTVMFQQFKFLIWATEISYANCLTLQSLAFMYSHDVNRFTVQFNLSLFMPWNHIEALGTQRCNNNVVISPNFYAGSVSTSHHVVIIWSWTLLTTRGHAFSCSVWCCQWIYPDIFYIGMQLSKCLAANFALIVSLMWPEVQKRWPFSVPVVLFGQTDHLQRHL